MRLVGGKGSHEGRVEINIGGVWGTVCDDGWDIKEAIVVCRHLNYPSARAAVEAGVYGPGTQYVLEYPVFVVSVCFSCKGLHNILTMLVFCVI